MPRPAKPFPTAGENLSYDFESENLSTCMVPTWLKKFLNGPASFWDLFSSYLAQSSYLARNSNIWSTQPRSNLNNFTSPNCFGKSQRWRIALISYFGRLWDLNFFQSFAYRDFKYYGWRNTEQFEKDSGRVSEAFTTIYATTDRSKEWDTNVCTDSSGRWKQSQLYWSTCGKTTCAYCVFEMHTLWTWLQYS